MNERDKVAHLLRRFGLGAGKAEMDRYAPLGVDGALERLLDYDGVDEGFPVSPWEFASQEGGRLELDPYKFSSWWGLRLLMTQRPLQERLTLFWHDHFAVSGEKVFDGPSMLAYQETLRRHASGGFATLLKAVSREPAMLYYLDNAHSDKDHPNENFAREVLELFTLGQGNFTEKDIRESARAFTGWSVHFAGIGDEAPYPELTERFARRGRSAFSFCNVPIMHDAGVKSILGRTGAFDGDSALELMAGHPATARHLSTKLWEWFATPAPAAKVVDRLAKAFADSGLQIKQVLRAIAESEEFWSERCVRGRPKSPIDFTLALFRQLDLRQILLALRGNPPTNYQPIAKEVRGAGDGVTYLMSGEGLLIGFPPDVGGWDWGEGFITSTTMMSRVRHADIVFVGDDPNRPLAVYLAEKLRNGLAAKTPEKVVDGLLEIFDGDIPAHAKSALVEACKKCGGADALRDKDSASALLATVCRLMFATPEFQVC